MFDLNTALLSILVWTCFFRITIVIVSFDEDKEIYQLDWVTHVATFLIWPIFLGYYLTTFIGNLLGKIYRWSK
jgi:hypothetical protein